MKRALILAIFALAACDEEAAEAPPPVMLTQDALGHFCQMELIEHPGPKAQIHLEGLPVPLFFAQVRDAVAYLHQPERVARITAVYVSNLSRAPSWEAPGNANWLAANDAHFVIGSDRTGGMGAPELAPFETAADAADFAARYGGKVMRLDDIPADAVLGEVAIAVPAGE